MIINLEANSIGVVVGGKNIGCHVVEPIKNGLEIGGTVMCLALERVSPLELDRRIANENIRKATMKGICGMMVGFSVELLTHMAEASLGEEC